MAFIGNTNTTQAFAPAIDYFNGDDTTVAFTLSRPVASVAQVQVVVNNVAQNPSSAYTVSGNTITFTSAPSSGTSNIYVYYTSPITQVVQPSTGTVGKTQLDVYGGTGTGAMTVPTGTTAQRPSNPVVGDMRWNTTTGALEVFVGSSTWTSIATAPYSIEYFLVGGGAGGGGAVYGSGGGGGGGYTLTGSTLVFSASTNAIVIGAGGAGGTSGGGYGGVGVASTATIGGTTYTANGSTVIANNYAGSNGGSGGGGGSYSPTAAGAGGSNGSDGGEGVYGKGTGQGTTTRYFGAVDGTLYAGGGGAGGSAYNGTISAGAGGAGGGANGGAASSTGSSASANTGGGGGGGGGNSIGQGAAGGAGGAGGSGVVVLRYAGSQRGTGGTVTSSGGYTIHTFTSSGTYTA